MEKTNRKILIVDDEQNILFALKRELHEWARSHGLEILLASSAKDALAMLETIAGDTDLIISDLRMPEMKVSDFLLEAKRLYPDIITMLLTGYSETEEIVKAVSAGIFSYMLKPWDSAYLLAEVEKAWNYHELQLQSTQYMKKLEEELRWAGEMQKALLRPTLPSTGGVEFRVSYRPVSGLYCSGDYYDVVSLGMDRYLMLVGDVAGHGVRAAFVTGILKAVIYPEYIRAVIGKAFSPADFLGWLNQRMQFEFRSASSMLITFFAGVLDVKAGTFLYANAGQTRPCMITGASVEELPVSGPAIGSGHSVLYMEKAVKCGSGSVLVCYTDGLSEVGSGIKVPGLLQKIPYGTDFHMRLLASALETSGAQSFDDDVTLMTARLG
jgi:sigma-B regulation protein RsbU (phosphoserine phosphatase)